MPTLNKPTVAILIRDEATASLDRIKRELTQEGRDAKTGGLAVELGGVEQVAHRLSYEFGSTIRLMGVSGALLGGGLVASIAAIGGALARFSRAQQQTQYLAEELGLTNKELVQFQYAARLFVPGESATGVENLARGLNEFQRNPHPTGETFRKMFLLLGPENAFELSEGLKRDFTAGGGGMRAAMLRVFNFIEKAGGTPENRAYIQERVGQVFDLGSNAAAFGKITDEELKRWAELAESNEGDVKKYLLEIAKLKAELQKMQATFGVAFVPVFTKLLATINAAAGGPEGTEFKKWCIEFVSKLQKINWEKIRSDGAVALPAIASSVRFFVNALVETRLDMTRINQIVTGWSPPKPIETDTISGGEGDAELKGGTTGEMAKPAQRFGIEPFDEDLEDFDIDDLSDEGLGEEPRSDYHHLENRRALAQSVKDFAEQLFWLNDAFREQNPRMLFHNQPAGGADSESNPILLPEGSGQLGGGSAAEARLSDDSIGGVVSSDMQIKSQRGGKSLGDQAREALKDVRRSLAEQEEGRDPRRMQRALGRVAPGSDEEWELRRQRALQQGNAAGNELGLGLGKGGYSEFQNPISPEGYGPGSGLPDPGEIEETIKKEGRRYGKTEEDVQKSEEFYSEPDWRKNRLYGKEQQISDRDRLGRGMAEAEWHKRATSEAEKLGPGASGRAEPVVSDEFFKNLPGVRATVDTFRALGEVEAERERAMEDVRQQIREGRDLPEMDMKLKVRVNSPGRKMQNYNSDVSGGMIDPAIGIDRGLGIGSR